MMNENSNTTTNSINNSNSIKVIEENGLLMRDSNEDDYRKLLSNSNTSNISKNTNGGGVGGGDINIIDESDSNKKTPFLVLAYLYFIVIASVLGTGILGLPVKLANSGFKPFVASYTLCFFMQLLSIFFLVEILQRMYSIIKANSILSTNNFISSSSISSSPNINNNNNTNTNNSSNNNVPLDILGSGTLSRKHHISPDLTNNSDNNNSHLNDNDELSDNKLSISSSNASSIKSSPTLDDSRNKVAHNDDDKEDKELMEMSIDEDNTQNIVSNDQVKTDETEENESNETPNLHIIGLKFLGPISYVLFIFSVLLHFCSVLIGYGLAGSEAYAQLFNIDHSYLIFPVILIFTLIVIFGSKSLSRIITLFTFGKGTLLITIVFITGIISNHVNINPSNNWTYIGKSFLISTVALGGASSVLPVVFPKIIFTKKEIKKCYMVAGSALFTVYVLNIIWCWFLLRIIPQLPNPSNPNYPSLEEAAMKGEIATIPLMKVVQGNFPQYLWIAVLVNIFIVISITISFITVGTGFKHTLDGFSLTWRKKSLSNSYHDEIEDNDDIQQYNNQQQQHQNNEDDEDLLVLPASIQNNKTNNGSGIGGSIGIIINKLKYSIVRKYRLCKFWINSKINTVNSKIDDKEGQSTMEQNNSIRFPIREFIFYILFFGFILIVALMNPKGFLEVMENGTSMGLNLVGGVFMVLMLQFSRKNYGHYTIPLPVNEYIYMTRYLVFIYFGFAVFYDFYLLLF